LAELKNGRKRGGKEHFEQQRGHRESKKRWSSKKKRKKKDLPRQQERKKTPNSVAPEEKTKTIIKVQSASGSGSTPKKPQFRTTPKKTKSKYQLRKQKRPLAEKRTTKSSPPTLRGGGHRSN